MTQQTTTHEFGPDFVLNMDDPAFVKDPYPTYRWLRENAPAYEWPGRHGVVFTRHKDVKAIYNDRRISNDTRLWEFAREEQWLPEHLDYKALLDNGLFRLGAADHARVRKLVSGALTPRSVERMRGDIQRTVDEVLSAAIEGDRLNVRAFAEPLPLQVISDMLKIPEELRTDFRAFGVASIRSANFAIRPQDLFDAIGPMPRWMAMLRGVIADRRQNPVEDDLLTTLIAARDGSAKLSEDEMLSIVHALITAGSDTTVHASCFAIYSLLRNPAQVAEIRENPALLRNAVEESLRYDLFGKGGIPKICTEELEVSGVRLRKGQMVYPFVPAALHDPEVFPEPERFDIHRDLSQTIAFGGGQHFCLGAALARMELDLGVGTLIQRYPGIRLLGEPEFEPNPIMRSIARLDVALS